MKKTSILPTRTAAAVVVMKCLCAAALGLAINLLPTQASSQSILLDDIDESDETNYNEYSSLTSGDGRLYFIGSEKELWTSSKEDPTDLIILKRFSSISDLTVVGATLYFVADDGISGPELWRSSGTVASTRMVKDINGGTDGSSPSSLTNLRGVLYFVANNGMHGRELWKSNGSPRGTTLVKDIMPRGGSSNPTGLTAVNHMLFFAAKDARHGTELWKTDGTPGGTAMVKDIRGGTGVNSSPSHLVNVYGTLFFAAADASAGRELWKSDGSANGTVRVKDIAPGTDHARIENTTAVYRTLFFTATDGLHGQELWQSDGTEMGTVMVKDMTPGPKGSQGEGPATFRMGNFTNIYGTLFFTAYENDTYYIWKSNGTAQGTVPVVETEGPGLLQPRPMFTFLNNRIYYFNQLNGEFGTFALMSMDKNGMDHHMVYEFDQLNVDSPYYPDMTQVNNKLYISGKPDVFSGFKMVLSDGTSEGTVWIDDARTETEGSDPKEFTYLNGNIYFLGDDTNYDYDNLHVTDGTPEGTRQVLSFGTDLTQMELMGNMFYGTVGYELALFRADPITGEVVKILEEYPGSPITILTHAGDKLFFATEEGGLYSSDGTVSGEQIVRDFVSIPDIHTLGDIVLFRGLLPDGTEELIRSDGTLHGTINIKTLRTGSAPRAFDNPAVVLDERLYFIANNGVHGNEVWATDGSGDGTFMVADLNTDDPASDTERDIRNMMVFRNELYLSAIGNDGKWSLYKQSDRGFTKVIDIDPIIYSVATEDKLLLFTDQSLTGSNTQLWITDGSAQGTHEVLDLETGNGMVSVAVVNEIIYFSTMEGGDLWRTDGTTCGTFKIELGSRGASPIVALNNILIFGSYDEQVGLEPHAYNTADAPDNPCVRIASSSTSSESMNENILPGYPNPFVNDFALRLDGSPGEKARVHAFTLYGKPVETVEVEVSTEQRIGQSWPKGIYVLQVIRGNTAERFVVVKQ